MDSQKTAVIQGTFTVEEDDIGPPPPNFVSRFKTMNEWLTFIVENEKPNKAISDYNIDVFEGAHDYTLCLTGVNTYDVSKSYQRIKIEFEPSEMYFPIPLNEHKGLTRAQVFDYISGQLNEFITSNKFKNSFLAEAKSVTTGWKGKIWSQNRD